PESGTLRFGKSATGAGHTTSIRTMRYTMLGSLEVSRVGLGCNNFGARLDATATRDVVDAAIDAGITFLDTADIYGGRGGSERVLGEVLQARRDRVVLATKFGGERGEGVG